MIFYYYYYSILFYFILFYILAGGTSDGSSEPIHRKTWFIFLLCFIGLILIILVVACIATARWSSNRKGRKYPGTLCGCGLGCG